MKFIVAIVKPQRLEAVRTALNSLGVTGVTTTDVKGYGRQKGHKEVYRGAEYHVDFVPKVKIEVAVAEDLEGPVTTAICEAARTGAIGDGKVFVFDLQDAIRVRTGETGPDAL